VRPDGELGKPEQPTVGEHSEGRGGQRDVDALQPDHEDGHEHRARSIVDQTISVRLRFHQCLSRASIDMSS